MEDTEVVLGKQKIQLLGTVLGLRSSLFLLELGVGLWTHSLSLLAIAGHMLSDMFAIVLALVAAWLAQQFPARYQRVEVWAALLNSLGLMAIAAFVVWESTRHLQTPGPVLGLPMLIVAVLSLAINSLNMSLLHKGSHHDLNLRGAFLHVVADAASSIGLILAALAIYFCNWLWADAVVGLLIAILLFLSGLSLVGDSLRTLSHQSI